MDEQRKRVYGFRQEILDGGNCKIKILEMIDSQVDTLPGRFPRQGLRRFDVCQGRPAPNAGSRARPARFSRHGFPVRPARAKEEAARLAEGQILDAIEENVPEDADQDEWNWEALAKFAQYPLEAQSIAIAT